MSNKSNFKTSFQNPSKDKWYEMVDKVLKGKPFEDEMIENSIDGIEIQALSIEASGNANDKSSSLQKKTGIWDIRQSIENPKPIEANKEIIADLMGGSTSIHLKLNMGGISGRRGIKIKCQDDMIILLNNIYLQHIKVSVEAGSDFPDATANLISAFTEKGSESKNTNICINADPIAALAQYGKLPNGLDVTLGEMGSLSKHMSDEWANVKVVGVDTRVYNLAGSTALQDVGFSLATGIQYLRILEKIGLSIEEAADQISFLISVDCDTFKTISKLRALREVWGRCLKTCGVEKPQMHIHAETAERMLTKREPWNNILRTTTAGLAAAIGGADSISILPFTQTLGGADDRARRIARNIQVILAEESHLSRVGDPAAGSWTVEEMTNSLTEGAWELMKSIEAVGGMSNAIEGGMIEQEISAKADLRNKAFEAGKKQIIGVTSFCNEGEKNIYTPNNGWKQLNYESGFFQQRLVDEIDEIPDEGNAV